MPVILSTILLISLLLGGGGATVYASQGSLPDQALYPIKLMSEDFRLQLASSPQAQTQLNLEFANRRLDEIIQMAQDGKTPDEAVSNRLQNQLNEVLLTADDLATDTKKVALENLRDNLEKHEAQLLRIQEQANPRAAAEFARVVAILRLRLELAEQGIKDPQALNQLKKELKAEIKEQFAKPPKPDDTETPEPKGPKKSVTPDDQPGKGKGPKLGETPEPPSGHVPGPKDPDKVPPGQEKKDSGNNDKGGKK